MTVASRLERQLERERIANRPKHWVRAVTACCNRCLFCLDSATPRGVCLPEEEVCRDLDRGRELGAEKVVISGGEASLHPGFVGFLRHARAIGYLGVQTVTNGQRFASRAFYEECVAAGLGEITFSLHGHTAELHDRLTGTPGSFLRLMKALVRAARDPRVVANVDVVVNALNVGHVDAIVDLCVSVGVTEFDLLHLVPHGRAFENRDLLFYDPRPHLPRLQRVFRLNRHPGYVVWTNRFPVAFLEGLEDLVQDPHKMLDEVNGRRHEVRRYLDEGIPLPCRQAERCVHCFVEPFCTTMDNLVQMLNSAGGDVWWVDTAASLPDGSRPLPFGCTRVGLRVRDAAELARLPLPAGVGLHAEVGEAGPLLERGLPRPLTLVAGGPSHLQAWLVEGPLPEGVEIEITLDRETARWLLENRERLLPLVDRIRLHQPSHEHLREAVARDVRDPAAFFRRLGLPVRASGLPACLAPGAVLAEPVRRLDRDLFDPETGRLAVEPLARLHVREHYRAKSLRCQGCRVESRCDGIPINMVRDQGLRLARPLEGAWADEAARQLRARRPEPPPRLATARPPEPAAPSLPGIPPPGLGPREGPA